MHSSMKFMLLSVFLDYSCSNSTCNLPKIVVGAMIVIILGSSFYATVKTSTSRYNEPLKITQENKYPPVSNEKIQEMRIAYNQVLADTLKPIFVKSEIRNEHWLNVYVNSLWYELNSGQKSEFISRCKNIYAGMLGARGIKIDFNAVNIFINSAENERQVAKYSGITGTTVISE